MRKKVLKVVAPEKCIGCEMCVFAAQRLCKKVGLDGVPIRILSSAEKYSIHLESSVNDLDVKKISDICPKSVFSVEEEDSKEDDSSDLLKSNS